ncbi:ankyrin [Lophiostoma macrostomum CBS 122681]|uniref:Ankyrin n=1 Tax=Lophiostoma macrostomum CBS 122681 TaxID=1314788 RepID=A0A6A6ST04_9PLEO|nr:ankyrin [Lophiostoma macrostomum CBS 122681]
MSLNAVPLEVLYQVASLLSAADVSSLIRTSKLGHHRLARYFSQLATRYTLANPESLTNGLHYATVWHDKGGNGTVLEWAAATNCIATFTKLLDEPAIDFVQPDSYHVTLLHRLAGQGKVEFMEALMVRYRDCKMEPFSRDLSNLTPLHFAAGCARVDAVQMLVAHGADVDARDFHGNTPLHLAAVSGAVSVFSALVDAGASVDAEARWGWPPIDLASISNHTDAVEGLLLLGASAPSWRGRRHGLNEYLRLSPCPKEFYFEGLEFD